VAEIPKSVKVKWPVGPHYTKWVKGKSPHSWVEYKLKSADWFLTTLVQTTAEVGRMDRNAGVEMAIDGALTGLCAAVDTAVSLLVRALEDANGIEEGDRFPVQHATYARAVDLAGSAALKISSQKKFTEAMVGADSADPEGWLAQLQTIRQLTAVENRLVPHWDLGHGNPRVFIDVPGLGLQEPTAYLKSSRDAVHTLVGALLDDVDAVTAKGRQVRQRRRAGMPARPLPDLSSRAHLVPPRRNSSRRDEPE
jgi:hypothetical protein